MMLLLSGLCLLWISLQDLRHRAVYWICFPILLILLFLSNDSPESLRDRVVNILLNIGMLSSQLLLVVIYFRLKKGVWVNLTADYLGWGDILLLACTAVYLAPVNYFLFYLMSLAGIMVGIVPLLFLRHSKPFTIPLAGIQALFLAALMIAESAGILPRLSNDTWLYAYGF